MQAWDSSQAHEPSASGTSGSHGVYTMESILSSLNDLTETWLTLGSASYHTDLSYTLLSGLALLFLYIGYLILRLLTQSLWRKKDTPKQQHNTELKRRKAIKRRKAGQKDPKEGRKLQKILQSQGKPCDPTGFRQQLCPDPLCNVCSKASSPVGHLLSQAPLEDSAASGSSLSSTAPEAEASITLPSHFPANQPGHPASEVPPHKPLSIPSQNQITPWDGVSSPIPFSPSRSSQAIAPSSTKLTSCPHLPPNASQLALQAEVPQSLMESPREWCPNVSTTKSTVYEPASSQPGFGAKDQSLMTSAHGTDQESGDHLSPSPDVLALFKRQEKGDIDVTVYKLKKEKMVSFLMPSNASGETSASTARLENMDTPYLFGNKRGKLGLKQQPSHLKKSEEQSEIEDVHLFWGLPSLHSESLKHEVANSDNSSPKRDYFNRMAKASTGSDPSDLTYLIPLPLPESDQQGQTLPQSQIRPDSLDNSKAETQSLTQLLPPSPQSKLRICGVRFHSLKDEAQPLTPCEIQQLEFNLLQKVLQSFLGLPTLSQRFQEGFCSPSPKIAKVQAPKIILPGDFPLSHKLERKLENHLRKRLIQHHWGLPHRIQESLSFMSPQSEIPEVPKASGSHGLSWISLYKFNANKNLSSFGLSQSGNFHKKPSEIYPLKAKDIKVQRQCPGIDQKYHLQGKSSAATKSSGLLNSETDPELQPGNMSERISKASWVKQSHKEHGTSLQEHVGKSTEVFSEGEMPSTVDGSGNSVNMAQAPPETSPRQMAPLAGKEDAPKKHQHSLILSPSKEKMLEEHITTFGRRMAFGLPQRVEESLESYLTKAEPSRPFPQLHGRAHGVSASDPDKSSRFHQRNTNGDKTGTGNLVPTQQKPLPATSLVSHIEPASEDKKVCVDRDLSTAPGGREPIQHQTPSMADRGILPQSGSDKRPGPELPTNPDGPTDERLAFSNNTRGAQGERRSWEDGSRAEGSVELLKGEQLPCLHSQSTKNSKDTQGLCSPGSHVTASQSLQGTSVPHNSETPPSESQVSREVTPNSEGGTHIQVPDLPAMPFASEEMTSKPQGPSSGDMAVSQVIHVHFPTVGINMGPPQGPWVPTYVSSQSKSKDCPPAARGVPPLAKEAGKLGGGDAGLGTSQTRGKRHCVQARALEETQGHTSSPALTSKSQPPEHQLTNQVKGFWQRLSPGRKHKGQEKSLAKGCSPLTSVKGTSLIKGRCEFCGNTEAQKCVRDPEMVLRRQLGCGHGTVLPCPQAPVSPLMGSEEAQPEVQLQAQAEPVLRLPYFCFKASCSQVPRAEPCSPGQGQTAPEGCGTTGKAKMEVTSPMHASPPKS